MAESTLPGQEAEAGTLFMAGAEHPGTGSAWYLVDLAAQPDALRLLFTHDPAPRYDLPYIKGEPREVALLGPLLIEPLSADCRHWLEQWLLAGRALGLEGAGVTFRDLREHLVSLNYIRLFYGDSLFRYAEPLSLRALGSSLIPGQRRRLLGPLSAIRGRYAGENWVLMRQPSAVPARMATDHPQPLLELTRDNLEAIERFRQRLLANRLGRSGNLEPQLVEHWFRQLESLGARCERALVEGCRILIREGFNDVLDGQCLARVRRAGEAWSDRLEALARLTDSQEGT